MATKQFVGAALAAWFSVAVAAQDPAPHAPSAKARLSAAAIAEGKGDIAAARLELQAALAAATATERTGVLQAIVAFSQRHPQPAPTSSLEELLEPPSRAGELLRDQGFGSGAQDPANDPVRRLIARLDAGSTSDPEVGAAFSQLDSLGALAVPPLLEALPKLGAFGRRNALDLIAAKEDPRVLVAVRALIASDRDPATIAAVADVLGNMPRASAIAIAKELVASEMTPAVRIRAFEILVANGFPDAELLPIANQLAAQPSILGQLLRQAEKSKAEWSHAILRTIAATDNYPSNMRARQELLLRAPELTEEQALAALAEMPAPFAAAVAPVLAGRHATWVRLGAFALRSNPNLQHGQQRWFQQMQWWRGGDEAMAALLSLPVDGFQDSAVRGAIEKVIATGWKVPPHLDAALARYAQVTSSQGIVTALPDDGQDRALAIWENAGPYERLALAESVVAKGRPWHRLVVRQLGQDGRSRANLLTHDWRGAPADVLAQLAQLVAGWQAESPWNDAQATRAPRPTTATSGPPPDWRQAIRAAVLQGFLPTDFLRPMLEAGDSLAWSTLSGRDPATAMEIAATWPDLSGIDGSLVYVILRHGDERHLELCIRAMRSAQSNNRKWAGSTERFFEVHGAGSPAVIALGRTPGPTPHIDNGAFDNVAAVSAEAASVRDLDVLLEMLPELKAEVAVSLIAALRPQLGPEHGAKIARTLTAVLDVALDPERAAKAEQMGRIAPRWLAQNLLPIATSLGAQDAIAQARRVLATDDADAKLAEQAVRALLQLTRDGRDATLRSLLADARPAVVGWALTAEDVGRDEALRSIAFDAILRCGQQLDSLGTFFSRVPSEALPPEQTGLSEGGRWPRLAGGHALSLAVALLQNERFPTFSPGVAKSILGVIGDQKSAEFVGQIALGARHPDDQVRLAVAVELGRTFSKDAAPYLIELLKDDVAEVRERADKCLEDIARFLEAEAKWRELLK